MQLTKLVIDRINEDRPLRLKIALALGVGEISVTRAIQRGSDTLTKYACIKVLKEEAGFTEEQIFEHENATS